MAFFVEHTLFPLVYVTARTKPEVEAVLGLY